MGRLVNILDGVTVICVFIISIAVVSVFSLNNDNKLAIVAVEAGLQECLAIGDNARIGQTVWVKECSK